MAIRAALPLKVARPASCLLLQSWENVVNLCSYVAVMPPITTWRLCLDTCSRPHNSHI